MPRKSRIDAPGAMHHIIAKGIERRSIFEWELSERKFGLPEGSGELYSSQSFMLLSGERAGCHNDIDIPATGYFNSVGPLGE